MGGSVVGSGGTCLGRELGGGVVDYGVEGGGFGFRVCCRRGTEGEGARAGRGVCEVTCNSGAELGWHWTCSTYRNHTNNDEDLDEMHVITIGKTCSYGHERQWREQFYYVLGSTTTTPAITYSRLLHSSPRFHSILHPTSASSKETNILHLLTISDLTPHSVPPPPSSCQSQN